MPNDTFGFSGKKRLDLSNIPAAAPAVPLDREEAAIKRGEALGFVGREPGAPEAHAAIVTASESDSGQRGKVVRKRPARRAGVRNIMVSGPEDVIDEFIDFVNTRGYSAYWVALKHFMDKEKAR